MSSSNQFHGSAESGQQEGVKTGERRRYLCFSLGEEEYAIPLLAVKEVVAMPEYTRVPNAPKYFLGIINLRGQVISVVDLRTRLGIKSEFNKETSVIICIFEGNSVGVVVDNINQVIEAYDGDVSPPPDISAASLSYITGIIRRERRLIVRIDIEKMIVLNEIKKLANRAEAA